MASHHLVRTRTDWIRIFEAAHSLSGEESEWAERIREAVEPIFPRALGVGLVAAEHGPRFEGAKCLMLTRVKGFPEMRALADGLFAEAGEAGRPYFFPPQVVTTHHEVEPHVREDVAAHVRKMRAELGIADVLGIVVHPEPSVSAVLFAAFEERVRLSSYERRLLTQVAMHLETTMRLRRRPDSIVGELLPSGKLVPRVDGAVPSALVARYAAKIDQSRSRSVRLRADAIDLWPALLAGRLGLVESRRGSQRTYLVVENPPVSHDVRALTKIEKDVLMLAQRGLSTKLVAYALGLSSSSVSDRLAAAAAKLGVTTRDELVRLGALLSTPAPEGELEASLTEAERDVLELLRRGMTNREIADARSRSVRTVANQVASLLRKAKVESRRGLLVARP